MRSEQTGEITDPESAGAEVLAVARRAKDVANHLRTLTRADKDAALIAMADSLVANTERIVAENQVDVSAAVADATPAGSRGPVDAKCRAARRDSRRVA